MRALMVAAMLVVSTAALAEEPTRLYRGFKATTDGVIDGGGWLARKLGEAGGAVGDAIFDDGEDNGPECPDVAYEDMAQPCLRDWIGTLEQELEVAREWLR